MGTFEACWAKAGTSSLSLISPCYKQLTVDILHLPPDCQQNQQPAEQQQDVVLGSCFC